MRISQVAPHSGQIGTRVTIRGQFAPTFGGGTTIVSVTAAGITASIVSQSATVLVIRAGDPTGTTPTGQVVVTDDNGATATSAASFVYQDISTSGITSVSPTSGQYGTLITVDGTSLYGVVAGTSVTNVYVNGVAAASISSQSATQVIFALGAGSSNGAAVLIVESNNGAQSVWSSTFNKQTDGVITAVTPLSAQTGASVVITGTNLDGHASSIAAFTVAGVDTLAGIVSSSATSITFTVPTGTGTGIINIVMNDGSIIKTSSIKFTFASITSVTPTSGQIGTIVTIVGVGLDSGEGTISSATLVGAAVTNIVPNAQFTIVKVTAGAHAAGSGSVVFTSPSGYTVSKAAAFTYVTLFSISSVTPATGQAGTIVTITGTGLLGGGASISSASLVGTAAQVTSSSATQVVIVAASASAGLGDLILVADTGATVTRINGWTYLTEGLVTSISPTSGQLGTLVTIAGSNLLLGGSSIASVTLNAVSATVGSTSNTQIIVTAAASSASSASDVVIVADTGATITYAAAWTYITPGVITSLTPNQGTANTLVTITGTGMYGGGTTASSVKFGSTAASIVSQTDSEIVVNAGATASTGSVTVTITSDTGATVIKTSAWTYLTLPVLSSISPSSGALGTIVTIQGTNLLAYGTTITSATLAGFSALSITSSSNTKVVLVAGASTSAIAGDVVLTSDAEGQSTFVSAWTYVEPPVITDVSPNTGVTGSEVSIAGINFFGGGTSIVSVTLCGVATTSNLVALNSLVVAVLGTNPSPSSSLQGDIVIVSDNGATITLTNGFTYVPDTNIISVSPSSGSYGTRVVIGGTALQGNANSIVSVLLNGVQASIVSQSGTSVTVIAQPALPGTGSVKIILATGAIFVATIQWTYITPPTIYYLSPSSGQAGTIVTILGANFLAAGVIAYSSIKLAGVTVSSIVSTSNSEVVVIAASSSSGTGDVVMVASTSAVVQLYNAWTYLTVGTISSISPTSGQYGTKVTITGTSLRTGSKAVTAVSLDGTSVLSIISESDTKVVVYAGDNGGSASSPGDVVVTGSYGATLTKSSAWSYITAGTISSISPNQGQTGTVITITGLGLFGSGTTISAVTLAGIAATIISSSDTQVIITAGSNAALVTSVTGDVVVISDTFATTIDASAWTYIPLGSITQIEPAYGQRGTIVTITGTNLLGGGASATSVTLASIAATVLSSSSTKIVIAAGASSSALIGGVSITSDIGAVLSVSNDWSYLSPGSISSVSPSTGLVGTLVTIQGILLLGGGTLISAVKFDGNSASVRSLLYWYKKFVAH